MAKKEQETGYGGYNHEFVGEIADRFNCQICTKVIREPHLAVCCGQHFCESCLNKWFTRLGKESCPHCRAEGAAFHHVINKGLRSEINQLKIKCSHHGKGCEWTGELGELKAHLESEKGCGFVVIQCPNKCINIILMRKDLEKHLNTKCSFRPYQCEHCGLKDTYQGIKKHYGECPAYPLVCPNSGCGVDGIKRRDMKNHRSKCHQEPVECPFAEAGCKIEVCRHQFDDHLKSNQQKHLLFVMGAYKQMKGNLQSTEAKLRETETKLKETEAKLTIAVQLLSRGTKEDRVTLHSIFAGSLHLKKFGDYVTVIMPQVSECHRSGKTWHSALFYFKEGYKMCLSVSGVEMESGVCTGVTVSIQLLQGERDDQLQWPIIGGPPLPLRRFNMTRCLYFYMHGLEQLQQVKSSNYLKGMSFVLVNDCLTFNIEYFRENYLRVEVKM